MKSTRSWFRHKAKNTFEKYLLPMAGRELHYLEIGVFEAASAAWMCRNVLTHPECTGVGIDPWQPMRKWPLEKIEAVYQDAKHNLSEFSSKFSLIRGTSRDVLKDRGLEEESIDIAYIDGNHWSYAVVEDFVLVLPLVKVGGVIIFDDYEEEGRKRRTQHVRQAVDAILMSHQHLVEKWFQHRHQFGMKVIALPHES